MCIYVCVPTVSDMFGRVFLSIFEHFNTIRFCHLRSLPAATRFPRRQYVSPSVCNVNCILRNLISPNYVST